MTDVADWLLSQGVNYIWVGARDLLQNNMIKWIRDDKIIDGTFWMAGEPEHTSGDCVVMGANEKHLAVLDCDTAISSYLCRLYPAV